MRCMKDTPVTTSDTDGKGYVETGGALSALVPIEAGDLQGSLRDKMNSDELVTGVSGTIVL